MGGGDEWIPFVRLLAESSTQDVSADPFDSLLAGSGHAPDRGKATDSERCGWRESVDNSLFRVEAQSTPTRTYSFEKLLQAATSLAENCLRAHVTLPADPKAPTEPAGVNSHTRLPACSCAFRGCTWEFNVSGPTRDEADHLHVHHPWDRKLQEHVVDRHRHVIIENVDESLEFEGNPQGLANF